MMIIKKFSLGECVYDNSLKTHPRKRTEIDGNIIEIDFQAIIDSQFSGGNIAGKYDLLKKYLGLGQFSAAPCGGFVNFILVISDRGNEYIVFSGVNEVENSHYIVTIHAIFKNENQSHINI